MIKILDIHIQFIKDMSYINMKLIEDVPNKKEYYKNNLEFMYTNMVKISNTAEQTQFTLEETKKNSR